MTLQLRAITLQLRAIPGDLPVRFPHVLTTGPFSILGSLPPPSPNLKDLAHSSWLQDDEVGKKIYPLVWGTAHVYPMAWCQKRIENGDEDNVWDKYTLFKDHREAISK